MVRRPHVFTRVQWYNSNVNELKDQIKWSYLHNKGPQFFPEKLDEPNDNSILGVISPHAGFSCSGPFAAHGFLALSKVKQVETFIILGTNHTGMGAQLSLFPDGDWETPLGIIPIDSKLSDSLLRINESMDHKLDIIKEPDAHLAEHSIDNQLPFLQYNHLSMKILPLCLADHSLNSCITLGKILAKLITENESEKNIKIVASSDFTHYENPREAKRRDQPVIDALLNFNLTEASAAQKRLQASICGFGPILTFLSCAKELHAQKTKLLAYGHSGETCGSMDSVVAYASISTSLN